MKDYKVKIWWSNGEYSEETVTTDDEPRAFVDAWYEAYPEIYKLYLYTPDGMRMIGKADRRRKPGYTK